MDEGLLQRVLKGIATRNYEDCAETVPETFGLSRSSVSRRYVKGTARKLAESQKRSLECYDLVALFLDGKNFADEELIIALGVTLDGHKIPLGFVQAATEKRARPSQDRGGLQQATYEEAKAALKALKPGLKLMNQSALKSLEEGLEEPDAPSPGTDADTEGFLPQHQLHRERQQLLGQLTHNVRH